jgi:hypothetical protein
MVRRRPQLHQPLPCEDTRILYRVRDGRALSDGIPESGAPVFPLRCVPSFTANVEKALRGPDKHGPMLIVRRVEAFHHRAVWELRRASCVRGGRC